MGFAVQSQFAEREGDIICGKIEELEAGVEDLRGRIQPATFLNSVTSLAAHDMATAVIFAHSVARTANYYAGGTGASSGTKEKHLAEAIEAVKDYIGVEGSWPLIEDEDKQDAIFRQLCVSQVTASSNRGQNL